jgi:hypothetical protein
MDPRELLKRAKRPPPSALVPASDGSKRPSSLKNRIRGVERLINKVRPRGWAPRGSQG